MKTTFKLLSLATGLFFLNACNNGTTTTTEHNMEDSTAMSSMKSDSMDNKMNMDGMGKEESSLMASMNKMMDKMSSMKMSEDFDMDFANMMLEHHQGAIDMSEIELKSGSDEQMKAMARQIISEQKEEQSKLNDIIKNSKPIKMDMGKHDDLSKEMEAMKAGMAEMKMTLNTDRDYALMMIPHHESAVKMAKAELANGMNSALKQMSQKMISGQTKEISEFKSWLSSKQ